MIVVAALLHLVGIPAGFVASAIESRVEREIGYQLTIGGTTSLATRRRK